MATQGLNWTPRKSSFIEKTYYNLATHTLKITFKGGYEDEYIVSERTYQAMRQAPSMGKFFHTHVKQHRRK